jgi:hypothetical protein
MRKVLAIIVLIVYNAYLLFSFRMAYEHAKFDRTYQFELQHRLNGFILKR